VAAKDGDDGTGRRPCGVGWRRPRTGTTAPGMGYVGQAGGSAGRCEGRRRSGPASNGDDDIEGRPAQARVATLGAEAAAQNKKMKPSQSELCGAQGERSSTLLQFF
jgi:hypothetical protein